MLRLACHAGRLLCTLIVCGFVPTLAQTPAEPAPASSAAAATATAAPTAPETVTAQETATASAADVVAAAAPTVSERIDELLERQAVGPLQPVCSDADFVRRISLDLAGLIPTAQQTRDFLADPQSDKRQRLVDVLLESDDFVRHLALQWNVILLERRADKYVPEPDWERYLLQSLVDRKPLDQLFRELIFPEVAPQTAAVSARFLLNRDAEPHAVARDVGRMLFGMDLQCAQCHDHPLIGDYEQQDYYRLFAFVQRTGVFTDPASKKARLSEKPVGEASFRSVFTGEGLEQARPGLPGELTVYAEPLLTEAEQYRVPPAKNVPGIPQYSRRELLAARLADSQQFRRNLANRLWALVFGRGLVHPLDLQHVDNPPSHPELLELLAAELPACGFDVRKFLRHLVLTRAYQRTCDAPSPETINFADIAARAERLARERDAVIGQVDALESQQTAAREALQAAQQANDRLVPQLNERQQLVAKATKQHQQTLTRQQQATARLQLAEQQAEAVQATLNQLMKSAAQSAPEAVLSEATVVLGRHARSTADLVQKLRAEQAAAVAEVSKSAAAVAAAEAQYATAAAPLIPAERLLELERAVLAADQALQAVRFQVGRLDQQLELCRLCAEYAVARRSDPAAAAALWASLLEHWTVQGQLAALKPLTPEQLAASALRSVGVLDPQITKLRNQLAAEARKSVEKAAAAQKTAAADQSATAADTAPDAASDDRARQVQLQTQIINQLRNTMKQFVTTYGGQPGEEFQATVNQALFLGNSTLVSEWLQPAGTNLAAELQRVEDPAELAQQLYLQVLSRPASPAEQQEVVTVLSDSSGERPQLTAELIWALLSSNEFRFNH